MAAAEAVIVVAVVVGFKVAIVAGMVGGDTGSGWRSQIGLWRGIRGFPIFVGNVLGS